jgi:hypothetical protein
MGGEESKIAERQRERECARETGRGRGEEVVSVVKWTVGEIYFGKISVGLNCEIK